MKIDQKTVEHVAKLAKLELSDTEKQEMAVQMQDIIEYMDQINQIDTDAIEPMEHIEEQTNVFREDLVEPSYEREEILKTHVELFDRLDYQL